MPRLSSVSSRSLTGQGVGKTVSVSSITPTASSINEGSGLTFNVVTANATSGSTLYWTVNHTSTASADFGATSGSFTITNNAGSFTVTPTADLTTEGAETFTVSVRSGSISGTVLGTSSSVTVNDTSTAPYILSYYGLSSTNNYTRVSSSRLTKSSSQAKFGTKSLQGTTVQGFSGRANAVNVEFTSPLLPPFTIEGWVYLTVGYTSPDWQVSPPIYLHGPTVDIATTNATNSVRLYGIGTGAGISYSDQIAQNGSSIGGGNDSGATAIPLNTWTHMALAIASDGITKSVWVNGTRRAGSNLTSQLTASMTALTLNAFGAGSGPQYIDEVRVSNIDRYGVSNTSITVPTATLTSDANTVALVKFEDDVFEDFTFDVANLSSITASSSKFSGNNIETSLAINRGGTAYAFLNSGGSAPNGYYVNWGYQGNSTPWEISGIGSGNNFTSSGGTITGVVWGIQLAPTPGSVGVDATSIYALEHQSSDNTLRIRRSDNPMAGTPTWIAAGSNLSGISITYGQVRGFHMDYRGRFWITNGTTIWMYENATATTPSATYTFGMTTASGMFVSHHSTGDVLTIKGNGMQFWQYNVGILANPILLGSKTFSVPYPMSSTGLGSMYIRHTDRKLFIVNKDISGSTYWFQMSY